MEHRKDFISVHPALKTTGLLQGPLASDKSIPQLRWERAPGEGQPDTKEGNLESQQGDCKTFAQLGMVNSHLLSIAGRTASNSRPAWATASDCLKAKVTSEGATDLSPALRYPQEGKQDFTHTVANGETEQAGMEAKPESPGPSQETEPHTMLLCGQPAQTAPTEK